LQDKLFYKNINYSKFKLITKFILLYYININKINTFISMNLLININKNNNTKFIK